MLLHKRVKQLETEVKALRDKVDEQARTIHYLNETLRKMFQFKI